MSQSQDAKGSGKDAGLLRRIAELEAEVFRLKKAQVVADAPLPAREALLAEVEKIAHLGSWFLNLETHEVKWSDELFRILGFDPAVDKASTDKYFQALHTDDQPKALAYMDALVQTGQVVPSEVRVVWSDGTIREIRTDGALVRSPDGKSDRVVGTVMDVTEARRAERERKQLEVQLRQAQKMEVVGRVAGGVAHDFNNLLTIISGNADLLIEENRDDRLRRIRDAAEVGAALTRQLLAFSRQAVVQPVALDVNTAVHDMVRILGRLLGEDIQIRLELCQGPAVILADRGQIQQILLNLAVNARDAMTGGGELTFLTTVAEGPLPAEPEASETRPRWVELSVKDTGKGMDAATKQRAFEPFFTTKEPGKGTGLGLSTVKDIVAQTGGAIHIVSETGSGTLVTVRFPWTAEPVVETVALPEPALRPTGESVLLVEDNPDLRDLVEAFLSSAGYRVHSVGRPGEAEALWATEGEKIDILIADMVMPEKSGLDLAKALAARKPGLKTLFISGYSPNRSGLGASAFLQKPFTRNELLSAVRRLWEEGRPGADDLNDGPQKEKVRPKLVPFPQTFPQSPS